MAILIFVVLALLFVLYWIYLSSGFGYELIANALVIDARPSRVYRFDDMRTLELVKNTSGRFAYMNCLLEGGTPWFSPNSAGEFLIKIRMVQEKTIWLAGPGADLLFDELKLKKTEWEARSG